MNRQATKNHTKLTKHKSTAFVFFVCINVSLAAFYVGYGLAYISTFQHFKTIIDIYDIQIGGQDTTQGIITGCVPVGAMIGAILSSFFLKKFSRRYFFLKLRNSFLLTNSLAIIGYLICFFKIGVMILIGRLIIGICVGIFSAIVPLYINQFAPLKLKNFGTLNQIFIASSQSFSFLFYYLLTEHFGMTDESSYIYVSNFCLITIIIQSVVFLFIFPYETPKYWLQKREIQKCKELLGIIYEEQWIQQVYDQLAATNDKYNKSGMIEGIQSSLSSSRQSILRVKEQIKMPKIAIFLAIHVALFQQLTGVNSVGLYGGKIIKDILPDLNKIIPIFILLLPAIAAAFTTELMKKFGRKTLLQFGGLMLIVPLTMMCIGFILEPQTDSIVPKILIVISLFIYMGAFGLTLGPIVWLMIPEFVQARIIPYSTMVNLTGAAICIIIFPIASAQMPNKAYLFGIFLLWGLGSVLVNHKYLVETKDKTKEQIYRELQKVQNS